MSDLSRSHKSEIDGLLAEDSSGICPLIVVDLGDEEVRGFPLIRSTMVVRQKSPGKIKARLCIRGDTIDAKTHAAAPTPNRTLLKPPICLSRALNCRLATLGISQAFLQSANVSEMERVLTQAPEYVELPWRGKLAESNPAVSWNRGFAFLMIRLLYGLRESPLRWFISLTAALRRGGFRQCRSDVCNFVYWDKGGICHLMDPHLRR